MKQLNRLFDRTDHILVSWMGKYGTVWLRISIGIIFLWFGVLKFFPGLSPAEGLAADTIRVVTFGIFSDKVILYGLALLETLIGVGLLLNRYLRVTLLLLFFQMAGTFLPILFFPGEIFTRFPYALTLEGQYIVKNLIIIGAGIVIGASVRKR
ncbi:MAG: DoxX family membrane protein [Bacteroidota bacterium]